METDREGEEKRERAKEKERRKGKEENEKQEKQREEERERELKRTGAEEDNECSVIGDETRYKEMANDEAGRSTVSMINWSAD
jgi:hypothetical protein